MAWALTPPHPIPRDAVVNMVKSSCGNVEALLEATGATKKAFYVPLRDGGVVAYIPLKGGGGVTFQDVAENAGRMVIRRGGSLGIVVVPPRVNYENPKPAVEPGEDVTGRLSHVLVEAYEVAESVNSVQSGDVVVVEIYRPKVDLDYPRFNVVMGSLPSCIAAQTIASAALKPVQIVEERRMGNRLSLRLRLMNWTDTPST